jgi:hypothetical protein
MVHHPGRPGRGRCAGCCEVFVAAAAFGRAAERPTRDHEARRTGLRPGTRRPRGRACDWPAEADPTDQGGPLTVHRPARMLPSGFILIRSGSPEKGPLGAAAMRRVAWLKGADRRGSRRILSAAVPVPTGTSGSRKTSMSAGTFAFARRPIPGRTGVRTRRLVPGGTVDSRETFGPRWDWGFGRDVRSQMGLGFGRDVRSQVGLRFGRDVRSQVGLGFGRDVWSQAGLGFGRDVWSRVGLGFGRDVWSQAGLGVRTRRLVPGGTVDSRETFGPRWD